MFSTIEELCSHIRSVREEKKHTIQKLSSSLKIREDYLDAIENAEFSKLPEGYERIFFKTYLKFLDLDGDDILSQADRLYFKVGSDVDTAPKPSSIDPVKLKKLMMWVPVIFVLGTLTYFVIVNFTTEKYQEPVQEITIEEAKSTIDTVVTPVVGKDSILIDSLDLRIEVVNTEFFYIKIDSVHEVKQTGRAGKYYNFKALKNFNVYVADGSNTRIFLNDSLVQDKTRKDYRINYLYLDKTGVVEKSITKLKIDEQNVETDQKPNIINDSTTGQ